MLPPTWLVGKKTRLRAFEAEDVPLFRRCRPAIDPQARGFVIQTLDGLDIGVLGVVVSGPHCGVTVSFIDDSRFGDGSAVDVLRLICGGLPRALPVKRIEAFVSAHAPRSLEAHGKAGFRREGVLRDALFDGKLYRDGVIMSVLVGG